MFPLLTKSPEDTGTVLLGFVAVAVILQLPNEENAKSQVEASGSKDVTFPAPSSLSVHQGQTRCVRTLPVFRPQAGAV